MALSCQRDGKAHVRALHLTFPMAPGHAVNSRCPGSKEQDTGRKTHCCRIPCPRAQLPQFQCQPMFTRGALSPSCTFPLVSSPWGPLPESISPCGAAAPTVLSQLLGSLGPFQAACEVQTAFIMIWRHHLPLSPCWHLLSCYRSGGK